MGRSLRMGCLGLVMVATAILTSCDFVTAFQARYGEVTDRAWRGVAECADELVPSPDWTRFQGDFPGMICVHRGSQDDPGPAVDFSDGRMHVSVWRNDDGLLVLSSMYINEFPSAARIGAMDRYQLRAYAFLRERVPDLPAPERLKTWYGQAEGWGDPVPRPPFGMWR